MNTSPKFKTQKSIRREMQRALPLKIAARKIQTAWRAFQRRQEEAQDRWERECEDAWRGGCDCGDWLCTGCGYRYISCCVCGGNCADGDYEKWGFCSRRCMVRAGSD
jgi:hypothetical protein